MAIHLLECAAHTDLSASKKLALMAIADDADKETRIGRAGLDAVMSWSNLKKSRALEVIAELVADGYLVRESGGYPGHRAEFVVFPNGCCALHGPLRNGSARPDPSPKSNGSGESDPNGSAVADPKPEVKGPKMGPKMGPVAVGPPPYPPISLPPNPRRAGGCNPAQPLHDNCRRCETTRRQQDDRERRAKPSPRHCHLHRGQLADHCGPCRSEQIGAA